MHRGQSVQIKSALIPMKEHAKLTKHGADPTHMIGRDYRGLVGSLLHMTMVTRPDICFAVKEMSRVLDSPGEEQ